MYIFRSQCVMLLIWQWMKRSNEMIEFFYSGRKLHNMTVHTRFENYSELWLSSPEN